MENMENMDISFPSVNLNDVLFTFFKESRLVNWEEDRKSVIDLFNEKFDLDEDGDYNMSAKELHAFIGEAEKSMLDKDLFDMVKNDILTLGINENGEFTFTAPKGEPE